jgi:hypothetical protein
VDSSHTQAEPALWAASALAVALGRPGLVAGEQRARFEKYLAETHSILKTYEPYDGDSGWNILPNEL